MLQWCDLCTTQVQPYLLTQRVSGGWVRNLISSEALKKLFIVPIYRAALTMLNMQYDCHPAAEQWQVAGTSCVCIPDFPSYRSTSTGTPWPSCLMVTQTHSEITLETFKTQLNRASSKQIWASPALRWGLDQRRPEIPSRLHYSVVLLALCRLLACLLTSCFDIFKKKRPSFKVKFHLIWPLLLNIQTLKRLLT